MEIALIANEVKNLWEVPYTYMEKAVVVIEMCDFSPTLGYIHRNHVGMLVDLKSLNVRMVCTVKSCELPEM